MIQADSDLFSVAPMSLPNPSLVFPKTSGQGLVYESSEDIPARLDAATIGHIITQEDVPPYIVVNHRMDSILVTRWPGRLRRVRILATAQDQPASSASYTRATSIEVCEELSPALLFGTHGNAVSAVQDIIPRLSIAQIEHLARHATPEVAASYDAAWESWLTQTDPASTQADMQDAGILLMETGAMHSPVGCAFTLAHTQYCNRIKTLVGSDAFGIDEDGDEYLRAPWSEALTALLAIIMALGAPHLSSEHSKASMAMVWNDLPT